MITRRIVRLRKGEMVKSHKQENVIIQTTSKLWEYSQFVTFWENLNICWENLVKPNIWDFLKKWQIENILIEDSWWNRLLMRGPIIELFIESRFGSRLVYKIAGTVVLCSVSHSLARAYIQSIKYIYCVQAGELSFISRWNTLHFGDKAFEPQVENFFLDIQDLKRKSKYISQPKGKIGIEKGK